MPNNKKKLVAITDVGLERFAGVELTEASIEFTQAPGKLFFEATDKQIGELAYRMQSINRLLLVLNTDTFTTRDDLFDKLNAAKFTLPSKELAYKVETTRLGFHDFSSVEVSELLAKKIHTEHGVKAQFKASDLTMYVHILDQSLVVGIDVAGFDLSKREYKIFSHPASLKGTVGYSIVRLSGFTPGEKLISIPCHDGVVALEATSYTTGFSLRHFMRDKFALKKLNLPTEFSDPEVKESNVYAFDNNLQHLQSTKKNAKIAGLHDAISFSKLAIEWLDTKFDEGSVDRVIGNLIRADKTALKQLCYQSSFVLRKRGTLTIVSRREVPIEQYLEEFGFAVQEQVIVEKGDSKVYVVVLGKN